EPQAAPGLHRPGGHEPAAGRATPGPAPAADRRELRRERAAPGTAPGPGAVGTDALAVAPDHQSDPQGIAGARRGPPDLRRDRDSRLRTPAPVGLLNGWPPATVQALPIFLPEVPYRCQ